MIFGIGFPRTGTHSLRYALEILGYDEIHTLGGLKRDFYRGNIRLPAEWQVVTGHCANFYIALDKKFPDSKFILTTRHEDDWLNSIVNVWHTEDQPPELDRILPGMWANLGLLSYDREVLRAIFRAHDLGVIEYFKGRDNLIVMHLENPSFESLCTFLNKPVPDESYPWIGKGDWNKAA